ncbi:hypothetical protein ACFPOE_11490 [Caenimonas terrae]|uniref:Uncharacterized protein n=1 Tax=Caenimonas terrae TaxID=696074 RepID=A0ABW0NDX6_9BURK
MNAGEDHWAGLGQRPGAEPPPLLTGDQGADDQDLDEFERPPVQRTVAAASAPSVVPKNAFHLPFLRAGSAAPEVHDDSAAAQPPEENTMPKQPRAERKARPTKAASPRFQICALLMAKGPLTREQLLEDVSAERTAFYNAVFNAKKAEHITFHEKDGTYRITKAGKEWTTGGGNLDNQQADAAPKDTPRAKPGRTVRKPSAASTAQLAPAARTDLAIRTFEPVVERSFRCAVFSDGGFHLTKNGVSIDLTAAEHAEMLRYQERMAEMPGA